jgi:protein-S-isoprenylcysteine O-methyltransferase Ste14
MKYLRAVTYFLATTALYLGIPLVGWSLGGSESFFASQARSAYAIVVMAFGLAVGIQAIDAPEGIRGIRGAESKLVHRQSIVRIGLILLFYAALVLLPFSDHRGVGVWAENPAARWIGVMLAGLGYALIFLSGLALGRQYSQEVTLQKDHRLIVSGVFRYIRNPRYLGVILGALGLSILFRSWAGLIASGGITGILLLRIKDEEALMHKEFGWKWEEYVRGSWRLLPGIY